MQMDPTAVEDRWERGNLYERYVGRWSRRMAPAFLAWLGAPPRLRWLDVGCGTGALCAEVIARYSPSAVIGVEPSAGFLAATRANVGDGALLCRGVGTAIPLRDAAVEVVVSGLVINFIPDARAAVVEMGRVTRPGGTIAAYVWDYAGRMEFLRRFWDAAVALDPGARTLDEGLRFPLCHPAALTDLFADAGLTGIETTAIEIPTPFAGFDDLWEPFLGGQGPAPAYVSSLDTAATARLRERLRAETPTRPDGSIILSARAWAARGTMTK
jgi:SAM-dependent methyltransferase